MRILGIAGSMRDGSVSTQMVQTVLSAAQKEGAQTDMIELRRYKLPYCDGRSNNDGSYGEPVNSLRARVQAADAIVVGTPELHGGYSGALKNFLDLNCGQAFQNKPIALVSACGGKVVSKNALNQLREVFSNLNALVIPRQAVAGPQDLDGRGRLGNDILIQRLKEMGRTLVDLSRRLQTGSGGPRSQFR